MWLKRAGVALVELVVAMTVTALVAGIALGGLARLQRTVTRQAERISLEHSLRGASQLIRSELRDAGIGAGGDLLAVAPASLIYRAVRGSGSVCGRAGTSLLLRAASLRTLRNPVPGRDSILVLAGPAAQPDSLRWMAVGLLGAPATSGCPDGSAAQAFPISAGTVPRVPDGAPARIVEMMEMRLYQSGGWWLGLRSLGTGETIQPAFGPFTAAGVAFHYLDRFGAETLMPAATASLTVVLRGLTSVEQGAGAAASGGPGARDSLTVTLPLRNAWP